MIDIQSTIDSVNMKEESVSEKKILKKLLGKNSRKQIFRKNVRKKFKGV